ncbi:hypothetical protein EB001_09800 [bacterium]|nr:hypothetical protein [bacterium]
MSMQINSDIVVALKNAVRFTSLESALDPILDRLGDLGSDDTSTISIIENILLSDSLEEAEKGIESLNNYVRSAIESIHESIPLHEEDEERLEEAHNSITECLNSLNELTENHSDLIARVERLEHDILCARIACQEDPREKEMTDAVNDFQEDFENRLTEFRHAVYDSFTQNTTYGSLDDALLAIIEEHDRELEEGILSMIDAHEDEEETDVIEIQVRKLDGSLLSKSEKRKLTKKLIKTLNKFLSKNQSVPDPSDCPNGTFSGI